VEEPKASVNAESLARAGVSIVALHGALDGALGAELGARVEGIDGPIVIDCARVTGADELGLQALSRLSSAKGGVTLRRVQPRLRELLTSVQLAELIAYAEREPGRAHRTRQGPPAAPHTSFLPGARSVTGVP
jgi:anti-anti-sigma regulatory factor